MRISIDPGPAASASARAAAESFTETCPKCRGTGRFTSYTGRQLGQCFACKGVGSKTFRTAPEVRAQARQRTAEAKAAVVADHQAELKWLDATLARLDRLPEGYGKLLLDLQARLMSGRELTDGQMAVIQKGMARSAQWAAERDAVRRGETSFGNGVDQRTLATAFETLRRAGARRPTIKAEGFEFSEAPLTGRNSGSIYVKDNGVYVGKIPAAQGLFIPVREFDPARMEALQAVCRDPQGAVKADAARKAALIAANAERRAAQAAAGEEQEPELEVPCGCCGILLTDPVSRARGIGPICAGKWGF